MRNLGKFISKHLLIYLLVLVFVVVLDSAIFFLAFNKTVSGISKENPVQTLQEVSGSFTSENGAYTLSSQYEKKLTDDNIWGILINSDGNVIWQHNLPENIPLKYTLQDVATFSKGYISDYPVFTWEQEDNLLVLGYPQNSYSKFTTNFLPVSAIQKTPFILIIMLGLDTAILFIVYYLSKRNVMLKITPILSGIDKLSHGEKVTLDINGELAEVGERINETSHYLKKQDQARANWISGVSHDIRTPLSMIMGYADKIATTSNIDESTKKQAVIIKTQSVKIKNLVQDLNLVSQLNYNIQPIQEKNVYLCKIIREIVTEYLNGDISDKFEFQLDLAKNTEPISIVGDERLLYRAIQNLISNSINHNENGCVISISLQANEDTLTLSICDNGRGVTEEELHKIETTPHYLQSTDDRLDLQHGLGLLLVKEIVAIHKGKIKISSTLNVGFSTILFLSFKN